jgi:hypothetical protein
MSSKAVLMRIAILLRTTALLFVFCFEIMNNMLIFNLLEPSFPRDTMAERSTRHERRSNSGRTSAALGTARSVNAGQENCGNA